MCKCQISDTFSTKQGISTCSTIFWWQMPSSLENVCHFKIAHRGGYGFTMIKMIYRNRAKEVERENDIGIGVSLTCTTVIHVMNLQAHRHWISGCCALDSTYFHVFKCFVDPIFQKQHDWHWIQKAKLASVNDYNSLLGHIGLHGTTHLTSPPTTPHWQPPPVR